MRRVILESARLRISKPGFDAETASLLNMLFDSDSGLTGSVAMSGITLTTPDKFLTILDAPNHKVYRCIIPLNRTFLSPPGFVLGMLYLTENRVNIRENPNGVVSSSYYATSKTTELWLYIDIASTAPIVIVDPNPDYAFSWIIFN